MTITMPADTPTKPHNPSPDDIAQAIISTAMRVVIAIPALAFLWALLSTAAQ